MTRDLTGIAKPCPMCGSKRIYMDYPKMMDIVYSVTIQCADCGLNGYKNLFSDVDFNDAMDRTIKYWNTRVESEEDQEYLKDVEIALMRKRR